MKKTFGSIKILALLALLLISTFSFSQTLTNDKFGKGINILAKDSSFSAKINIRAQTLYEGRLNLDNSDWQDKLLIRRARIKVGGFAYHPSLTYKLELGLSNRDIGGGNIDQTNNTARIILDAVLKWQFAKHWSLWFGQTKLPGNRERVISSQNLQFVDRSNLNSRFNIDRDIGLQLWYKADKFKFAASIAQGEGRNITASNDGGYDYTLRGEFLPFGKFSSKGDYFGADLKREESPKLAIGATLDFNDRAARERGQQGSYLDENRDLRTIFLDAHFKYRGFSSMVEFADKNAPDGAVLTDMNGDFVDAFYTGTGFNIQAGYLCKSNLEVAARYTNVNPEDITMRNDNNQYTLGVSKYISGHNLKVQSDISVIDEDTRDSQLMFRFQVEMGF